MSSNRILASGARPPAGLLALLVGGMACGEPDPAGSGGIGSSSESATLAEGGATTVVVTTTTVVDATGTGADTTGTGVDTTGAQSIDDGSACDLGRPSGGSCVADAPVIAAVPCDPADVTLVPPFDEHYDCFELNEVPNVPSRHGGVTFSRVDPDVLLIGGDANTSEGLLYSIRVARDAGCHVTGFAEAEAQVYAEAAYNDGGVEYGPGDVLFLARWPANELGQLLSGSVAVDRVDLLEPLGVGPSSIAGLTFVPPTFPGEGQLKVVTWPGGEWFTLPLSPAGDGTFVPGVASPGPVLPGEPEGIVYVSGENAGFDDITLLVSEFTAGNVATYLVDDQGDPLLATRQDFIVGLDGAEGAHIDPTSGDFLFSTFGSGDRLIVITGFVPNPGCGGG